MTTPNLTPEALAYQQAREAAHASIATLVAALDGLYRSAAATCGEKHHERLYYECQEAADRAMELHLAAGEAFRKIG